MIKRNQALINRLNVLSDAVCVLAAYAFASWLWLDVVKGTPENLASIRNWDRTHLLYALAYSTWTIVVLAMCRVYHTKRSQNRRHRYRIILVANTIAIISATSLLFVFRLQEFSRGVIGLYLLFSNASLIGKRLSIGFLLRFVRRRGYNLRHILLIGSGELAQEYMNCVEQAPQLGLKIDEVLAPGPDLEENVEMRIHEAGIDEVVLALDMHNLSLTEAITLICERNGVQVSVIPFYNSIISNKPTIENVGTIKLIRLRTSPLDDPINALGKRIVDIGISAVMLALLSPLLALIAASVWISSPGPVIFRQERIGLNRKPFIMYKFRSMRQNDEEDCAWSKQTDSRRTFIGSLLRKTSLDELPQLWNVLKGDMSLVGPRPEIPQFVDQFRDTVPMYMLKHRIRPGITGLAQVRGYRGDTSIPRRIKSDIWYIENWSFGLDIKILFRTAFGGMLNHEKIGGNSNG